MTVWCYPTPFGAEAGATRLRRLQASKALTVHDSVAVTWMPGAHTPRIVPVRTAGSAIRVEESVLAALMYLLVPAMGRDGDDLPASIAARLGDAGADPEFFAVVAARFGPGTSALLVLSSDADLDAVRPYVERGLVGRDVALLHAELEADVLARLGRVLTDVVPRPRRSGRGAVRNPRPSGSAGS